MSSLEQVLFSTPWITYNNKFIQSRITLTYPENVIFTAQFVKHVSALNVYNEYPYAERLNVWTLGQLDWTKTLIVFNRDLQLLFAPEPVHELIQLDRRLHYREAFAAIFEPFRFFPSLELHRYQWVGFCLILFLNFFWHWSTSTRYKEYSLVLSNKPSGRSRAPRR